MKCKAFIHCQHPAGTLSHLPTADNEEFVGLILLQQLSVQAVAQSGERPAFGLSVSTTHPLGDSDPGVEQTEESQGG